MALDVLRGRWAKLAGFVDYHEDDFDPFEEFATTQVRGDSLKPGMILVDADGIAIGAIDHRNGRASDGSVPYLVLDLDSGKWTTERFKDNKLFTVVESQRKTASGSPGRPAGRSDEAFRDRLGRCYELAGRFVVTDFANPAARGSKLVHGSIQGFGNPRIGHAWVIMPDGTRYDPVADEEFDPEVHESYFNAIEDNVYDADEVRVWTVKTGHWGPWEGPWQ